MKKLKSLFSFLIYLTLFLYFLYPYSDYDWGWHYRYGEHLVTQKKLIIKDPYSWTMPDYQWTNHSWAYDPILYLLYTYTGFLGLSITAALIGIFTFYLSTRQFKLSLFKKSILAFFHLFLFQSFIYQSFRTQTLSALFFTFLMYLIFKHQKNQKALYFSPLLFLCWANFHGSFLLGLILLTIYLFSTRTIELFCQKLSLKKIINSILIIVLSFSATLINPFFFKIYTVSLKHAQHPWLKNVMEWQSPTFNCNYCHLKIYLLFTALITLFFAFRKKIKDLPLALMLIPVFVFSLEYSRYMGIFYIITLPILGYFLKPIKIPFKKTRQIFFLSLLFPLILYYALFQKLPQYHLLNYSFEDYCYFGTQNQFKCSLDLINYLKTNPPQGKGFNFYDWGGFLIGHQIDTKLFIDGRMHLWQKDNYYPFGDYIKIYYWNDLQLFSQYDFDWLILRTDSPLYKTIIQNPKKFSNYQIKFLDQSSFYLVKKTN